APLDQQSRPQDGSLEWPPCRDRHRADLLSLRPRSGDGDRRQPDRPLRNADGPSFPPRFDVRHPLPHLGRTALSRPPMPRSLVKPNRPIFTSLGGLAAMVEDGDRFGVGGHHFARLPIALLCAITARRLRYVSWAGGLPLEMLLEADAVASIDICFSSLDVFGLPPRFRAAAEKGTIPVRDWTALAMIQALRARQQNLPMLPFQLPVGSDMMALVPAAATIAEPLSGGTIGAIPPLELDTFVLHAPRADEAGNVEIIGAKALDLAMVGAAAKVLVTVDEIVARGGLSGAGRQTILTRNQVTAIAEAPGGAWPASCLPFYVTDYAALHAILDPASSSSLKGSLRLPAAGVPDFVRTAAGIRAADVGAPFPAAVRRAEPEASVDEIMVARIAAGLDNECFASAGAVSPLANVAYRLAKATHAPDMIIAT